MMDCYCRKQIGSGDGEISADAAKQLVASGSFDATDGGIRYSGRVGSTARNEFGFWCIAETCPAHEAASSPAAAPAAGTPPAAVAEQEPTSAPAADAPKSPRTSR